jgi:DHA2 family multidrug resistance protein
LGINAEAMYFNTQLPFGLSSLNGLMEYRAAVQAYANDFLFMFYISLPVFVVIWLMRRPSFTASAPPQIEAMD